MFLLAHKMITLMNDGYQEMLSRLTTIDNVSNTTFLTQRTQLAYYRTEFEDPFGIAFRLPSCNSKYCLETRSQAVWAIDQPARHNLLSLSLRPAFTFSTSSSQALQRLSFLFRVAGSECPTFTAMCLPEKVLLQ